MGRVGIKSLLELECDPAAIGHLIDLIVLFDALEQQKVSIAGL